MEQSQWSWLRAIIFILGFMLLAGYFGRDDFLDETRIYNAEHGLQHSYTDLGARK